MADLVVGSVFDGWISLAAAAWGATNVVLGREAARAQVSQGCEVAFAVETGGAHRAFLYYSPPGAENHLSVVRRYVDDCFGDSSAVRLPLQN